MQNIVYLRDTDWMVNSSLIRRFDLLDFDYLTFRGFFTKRRQNCSFLIDAHITAVPTVMITGNCFNSAFFILRYELLNIFI